MRANARNRFQRLIGEAVRAARAEFSRAGIVSRETTAAEPAQHITAEGTDAGGNITTQHIFMLGVDALGDGGAELNVTGNPPSYYRSR